MNCDNNFISLVNKKFTKKNYFLSLVSVEDKMKIYYEFQEKFPRAQTPQRRPLDFTSGKEFLSLLILWRSVICIWDYWINIKEKCS